MTKHKITRAPKIVQSMYANKLQFIHNHYGAFYVAEAEQPLSSDKAGHVYQVYYKGTPIVFWQ